MKSASQKYIAGWLGVASSLTAAMSVAILASKIDVQKAEILALASGILAVGMAATSAAYMRWFLRRQRLRHALRRVFIIYAKEDLEKAREIAALLRDNDLEPWLDVEQIQAGQIWRDALNDALDESAMAVVLSSQNFSKSSTALEELNRAISKMESSDRTTSPIIPIKIDKSEIPKSISHIQHVDFEMDGAKNFLIKSIEGAMNRIWGAISRTSSM